jgi:glycosyltransferase involved in cell wall biosynthesis
MSSPLVSVIMPVYNCENYLNEAIDSILSQSFINFEFLIINDGSTDDSGKIINNYSDIRIIYHEFEMNEGLIKCLNFGIQHAQGKYIARMDADDISLPNRFAIQVDYLEKNPLIGVCGSFVKFFGQDDRVWEPPCHSNQIKAGLINGSMISHPASMIRSEILKLNNIIYNEEFYPAEDYYLWLQLSTVTDFHNIPRILLKYRINENQLSTINNEKQFHISQKIRLKSILKIPNLNPLEVKNLLTFDLEINKAFSLLKTITKENKKIKIYNNESIKKELSIILLTLILLKGDKRKKIKLLFSSYFLFLTFQMQIGLFKRIFI